MLTTSRPLRAAVLCSRRAPGLLDLLERDRRRGEAYDIACRHERNRSRRGSPPR